MSSFNEAAINRSRKDAARNVLQKGIALLQ